MLKTPDPKTVAEALRLCRDELLEDERTSFTFEEAGKLANELGFSNSVEVIAGLKALGLEMEERQPARRVRGVRTSSNDRWFGPGACKTHGGSGHEQITGFAGQRG